MMAMMRMSRVVSSAQHGTTKWQTNRKFDDDGDDMNVKGDGDAMNVKGGQQCTINNQVATCTMTGFVNILFNNYKQ